MTTPRQTPAQQPPAPEETVARKQGDDIQPPATGATTGSPAARVMKQTAKTRSESTGRP